MVFSESPFSNYCYSGLILTFSYSLPYCGLSNGCCGEGQSTVFFLFRAKLEARERAEKKLLLEEEEERYVN